MKQIRLGVARWAGWAPRPLAIITAAALLATGCPEPAADDDDDTTAGDDDTGEQLGGEIHGPDAVEFGEVEQGPEPGSATVELRNRGAAPLEITLIQITGDTEGAFAVSYDMPLPTTVPPDLMESVYVLLDVTFDPVGAGERLAQLEIYSSDFHQEPDTPHVIPLFGLGLVDEDGDGDYWAPGWDSSEADCDDDDPTVGPGQDEICDGLDNDCDGALPAGEADADGDGVMACKGPTGEGDCDDLDPDRYPGAVEQCDAVDNDCDGVVPADEADGDTDGFRICAGDCDDNDDQIFPGAPERCNRLDDDCDGTLPAGELDLDSDGATPCEGDCDDVNATLNLADADGDGVDTCSGDCDDADADTHPGAVEQCNRHDDDCDGLLPPDEIDGDADGATACEGDCDDADVALNLLDADADGFTSCGGDCDDADDEIHPAAAEVCNDSIDNDCDGGAGSCVLGGVIGLETADAKLVGETEDDYAGYYVECAGDHNGDGIDDLLVGAPKAGATDPGPGRAYLIHGPFTGEIDLGNAHARFLAEPDGSWTGTISSGGDVDGDGHLDVLVGSMEANSLAGAAYLQYGPVAGDVDLANAHARFVGTDMQFLGDSLELCKDIDGDGYEDFLISAHNHSEVGSHEGTVLLFYGAALRLTGNLSYLDASARFVGEADDDHLGTLAGLGDTDGDGLADLAVATIHNDTNGEASGAVYVFLGDVIRHSGLVDVVTADGIIRGDSAGDAAGIRIASAGDTNGDGLGDLLITASDDSNGPNCGAVHLFLGPVSGVQTLASADATIIGSYQDQVFGYSPAGVGDLNQDGMDDIAIGVTGDATHGTKTGAVHIFYGPFSGSLSALDTDLKLTGEASWDRAVRLPRSPCDLSGEGYLDLLVGAAGHEPGGAAYVVHGVGM